MISLHRSCSRGVAELGSNYVDRIEIQFDILVNILLNQMNGSAERVATRFVTILCHRVELKGTG